MAQIPPPKEWILISAEIWKKKIKREKNRGSVDSFFFTECIIWGEDLQLHFPILYHPTKYLQILLHWWYKNVYFNWYIDICAGLHLHLIAMNWCIYIYKYKYKICILSNILTVIRLCACLHRFLLTGPDWLSPGPLPRPHPSSQGIRIRVLPFWIIFSFFSHSSFRTSELGIMRIFRFVIAASYHMGHFYAAMSNQSLFSNKTIWILVLAQAWYLTK